MEMMIVVAIIAVLVAIALPVLGNKLECAREAVDMVNIRNAMTDTMQAAVLENKTGVDGVTYVEDAYYQKTVYPTQKKGYWQTNGTENDAKSTDAVEISGLSVDVNDGNDGVPACWCIRYLINNQDTNASNTYSIVPQAKQDE